MQVSTRSCTDWWTIYTDTQPIRPILFPTANSVDEMGSESMHSKVLEEAEVMFETEDVLTGLPLPYSASAGQQTENWVAIQGNHLQQAFTNDMHMVDSYELHFNDQLHPYSEAQWYSSSSEHLQGFYSHEDLGASLKILNIDAPPETLYAVRSAFVKYNRSPGTDVNGSAQRFGFRKSSLNLLKRCIKFLRTIDTKRSCNALSQEQAVAMRSATSNLRDRSAFHHMIAERNRRVKLNQHFSYLRSLLPKTCKKDKYSILLNTTWHLNELKLRIDELERRNYNLEEILKKHSIANKDALMIKSDKDPSKSTTSPTGSQLYNCHGIVLEQPNANIPDEIKMRISVQNPVSNPTDSIVNLLKCLKELELEVVSIQSDVQAFQFQADLLIRTQGERWNSSRLVKVGDAAKRSLCL